MNPLPKSLPASLRSGVVWLRALCAAGLSHLLSALLWFLLFACAGACLLVLGVYVLAGIGWAMVTAGVLFVAAGCVILKGMTGA